MHKLNPRTAALLSAFGWAVGYLLAGKALAVLLPVPPGGAARFFRVCLLAPLAEEGVFRGAVQRRAQPLGRGQAILLQAVLFALQHGSAAAMAYALVCGLGLGWLADRTGHLWPGMLLHSANNLLVLAMDVGVRLLMIKICLLLMLNGVHIKMANI
mgnify:CR=1 FL=1